MRFLGSLDMRRRDDEDVDSSSYSNACTPDVAINDSAVNFRVRSFIIAFLGRCDRYCASNILLL